MAFVTAAVALYAEDTRLESPLVRHLLGTERGIVEGRDKLRDFLHIVFERTPPSRRRYRTGFFTDGRRLIWEYPRETPDGDQMDFVEFDGDRERADPAPLGLLGLVRRQGAGRGSVSSLK